MDNTVDVFNVEIKTRPVTLKEEYPMSTIVVVFDDFSAIEIDTGTGEEIRYKTVKRLRDVWGYTKEEFYDPDNKSNDQYLKNALEKHYKKKIRSIHVFESAALIV